MTVRDPLCDPSAWRQLRRLSIFDGGGVHCDTDHGNRECRGRQRLEPGSSAPFERFPNLQKCIALLVAQRTSYIELTRMMSTKRLQGRVAQHFWGSPTELGTEAIHCGRKVPSVGPVVSQSISDLWREALAKVNRILKIWERAGWLAIKDRSISSSIARRSRRPHDRATSYWSDVS